MTSDNFLKCKRLSVKSSSMICQSFGHRILMGHLDSYADFTLPYVTLVVLFILFVLLQDMTNVLFTVTCTAGP